MRIEIITDDEEEPYRKLEPLVKRTFEYYEMYNEDEPERVAVYGGAQLPSRLKKIVLEQKLEPKEAKKRAEAYEVDFSKCLKLLLHNIAYFCPARGGNLRVESGHLGVAMSSLEQKRREEGRIRFEKRPKDRSVWKAMRSA